MTSLHHQLVRSWANQRDHLTGSHSAPVPCRKEADECEPVCLVCFCVRTQWIVSYFCILFVFFERHNIKTEHQLPTAMCSLSVEWLDCLIVLPARSEHISRSTALVVLMIGGLHGHLILGAAERYQRYVSYALTPFDKLPGIKLLRRMCKSVRIELSRRKCKSVSHTRFPYGMWSACSPGHVASFLKGGGGRHETREKRTQPPATAQATQ